jgi:TPR repeat protein
MMATSRGLIPEIALSAVWLLGACPARDIQLAQTPADSTPTSTVASPSTVSDGASLAPEPPHDAADAGRGCTTGADCTTQGKRAFDRQEYAQARELFERACALQDPLGCKWLALDLDHERGPLLAADGARGHQVMEKACDLGELEACWMLGNGYLYGNALGVTRDPERAVWLYQKGCDGGEAGSCASLANCYADGLGVAKDKERAKKMRKRAEQLGYLGE